MNDVADNLELTSEEVRFIHGALNLLWKCPKCEAGLYNSRGAAITANAIQGKIEAMFTKEKKDVPKSNGDGSARAGAPAVGVRDAH